MHRRLSWTGPSLIVLAIATATLSACSFDSPTSSGSQLTGSGVDTIPVVAGYTGTFAYLSSNGGSYEFTPSSELEVGDLPNPNQTNRGIVTFNISALDGDTAQAASLRVYECDVNGSTFSSLGTVVVDHITPGTPPGQSQYAGETLTSDIGTIAPDATTGFRNLTVTSAVQSDVAANGTYSQFRLRFSNEDGNPSGATNYVDFETAGGGDCAADAYLAPVLIVTY
jgi:hypothetical protein